MKPVPEGLTHGPFSLGAALAAGVTPRMLEGKRFVRIHPRVYRCGDHVMTADDWVRAAQLALPAEARTTGITRLQQLGIDFGERQPVHFVVQGDLHLSIHGIVLHRTVQMPPVDDVGVTPSGAFVAYCRCARIIDAIKVGDWMLAGGLLDLDELDMFRREQPWRDGVREAMWVLDHLDGGSRSLRESETRALLVFAGLPRPRCNAEVDPAGHLPYHADLWYDEWRLAIEYEGSQHQEDRAQFTGDMDRYADFRQSDVAYLQVTKEKLGQPRRMVLEVHSALVRRGYRGPPPMFEQRWRSLFRPVHEVARARGFRRT